MGTRVCNPYAKRSKPEEACLAENTVMRNYDRVLQLNSRKNCITEYGIFKCDNAAVCSASGNDQGTACSTEVVTCVAPGPGNIPHMDPVQPYVNSGKLCIVGEHLHVRAKCKF